MITRLHYKGPDKKFQIDFSGPPWAFVLTLGFLILVILYLFS